ncbi:MAG: hypothetical protein SFY80_12245 [Verrucomicrobiota bacterium]|nr:hypothetical protein [Verrucomicrobiota bacterium]
MTQSANKSGEVNATYASELHPAEAEIIRFFVNLALELHLPRSLGEIYGYLYCADKPLRFDEIVAGLHISKGSASQGLRWLQQSGAVLTVHVQADRRSYYSPERRLRKLTLAFIRRTLEPRLESGSEQLQKIEALLADDPAARKRLESPLISLRAWNEKARGLLPLLTGFVDTEHGD